MNTRFVLIVASLWLAVLFGVMDNPTWLLQENWPIIFIAFASAAVANATAVGGGFIFLPLFSFAYSLSAAEALKLALATQAFGMSSGALGWSKKVIDFHFLKLGAGAGVLGMFIGTFLFTPPGHLIHNIFGYASIVVSLALFIEMIYIRKTDKTVFDEPNHSLVEFCIWALLGGLITAWTSIGIGEVVALWLLFRAKQSIVKSVATGVAVLAICSISGLLFHIYEGGIVWEYLIFTAPGVLLGGRAGALLGKRMAGVKKQQEPHIHNDNKGFGLKLFVALVIFADGIVVIFNQ
ncbi:sulfite exporter TauE/SafE family protein [Marinomonas mediterranea]|uniref:sulfite exporter TauE/SafE family protein n=1 Tax=Marinomonas mediterranea TaxID=119864 RepID=UPI00234A0AB7|nr:sulfite exporter TauE/SafE family protein [Marinomonas mediterranea]WCN11180.1 TSUP family transporter [Marinomonas mediterranea]WCN15242.1 TSUP family transporter [Marinomonas mediterranea]